MSCDQSLRPDAHQRLFDRFLSQFFPIEGNNIRQIYIYIYRTWGKKCAPCAPGLIRIHRSLTRVLFSSSPSFFFFFLRTVGCNCITNFARYYKGRGQFSCFLFSWWGGRERAIGEQENVNIGAQRGQGG